MIADVSLPILGADFLENYEILLDLKNRRLLYQNKLEVKAYAISGNSENLSTVNKTLKYYKILSEFPNITNPAILKIMKKKHGVTHHILTEGQPIFSKARRVISRKN